MKQMEAEQKTTPVRKMLAHMNDPARINADHREFYYALLLLGNATEQSGAHVNGAWYLRNAKSLRSLFRSHGRLAACSSFSVPAPPTGSAISCKQAWLPINRAGRLFAVEIYSSGFLVSLSASRVRAVA